MAQTSSAQTSSARASELVASPAFQELQRTRARVATVLTTITIAAYFSFILLMAYAPEVLAQRVGGVVIGIPYGIGVILLSWLLTGIYTRWANNSYDALVAQVRAASAETAHDTSGETAETKGDA